MEKKIAWIKLSIVIPVYGSAMILPELVRQLQDAITTQLQLDGQFEIILVNDCGPGDSWSALRKLAVAHPFVKAVGLRKNAGQHNAIMAGLNYAQGEVVVMMDDDLQHSPYDIPALYHKVLEGYDVCYVSFKSRHHAKWKILGSEFNDRVAQFLLKKPKGLYLSPFKAIKREIRNELIKYHGPHVYLDGLILTVTANIATVSVEHYARYDGEGGYGFGKSMSLWLKMATNFSVAPLRFASILGVVFSVIGFFLAVLFTVQRLLNNQVPEGWASLMVIALIMGGIQLLAIGAIGEYVGRIFLNINNRPQFVVAQTLNFSDITTDK